LNSILDNFRDVIAARIPLAGSRVLDVGCGDGSFVRELARAGAVPTGMECSATQLELCRKASPVCTETYLSGVGEDLPFDDATFDATVFRASLHHVPPASMNKALREARRVTRPGGELFIFEPLTVGTHFQLTRLVDDETEVRRLAQAAIALAVAEGWLSRTHSETLDSKAVYRDFDALRQRFMAVDASRGSAFRSVEQQLRRVFESNGIPVEAGRSFSQPFRLDVLK
jgi:ubiquinone/menaquinone biosynthesis C-methylase UbiE